MALFVFPYLIFFLNSAFGNLWVCKCYCCGSNFSLILICFNQFDFLFSFVSEYSNKSETKENKKLVWKFFKPKKNLNHNVITSNFSFHYQYSTLSSRHNACYIYLSIYLSIYPSIYFSNCTIMWTIMCTIMWTIITGQNVQKIWQWSR